jgi:hypothetical protein
MRFEAERKLWQSRASWSWSFTIEWWLMTILVAGGTIVAAIYLVRLIELLGELT